MKVIKRNGTAVDFDPTKIKVAIEKANAEVKDSEKAKKGEIKEIISYIENLDKKRILVEDIQDIVEEKLMEYGHYPLAKNYIIYRYNRALIRKSNTTDETILTLIKNTNKDVMEENSNKNPTMSGVQRDYIKGKIKKDRIKYCLLTSDNVETHEKKVIHF